MLRLVHSMQRTNAPRNAAWASAKPYCRVSAAAVQPPLERDRQGRCGVSSGYSERTLRDDVCAFGHQVLFECVDAHGALLRVEMLHATIHHATMQHAMYHAASHATCDVHAQPATLCAAQLCFALLCPALRRSLRSRVRTSAGGAYTISPSDAVQPYCRRNRPIDAPMCSADRLAVLWVLWVLWVRRAALTDGGEGFR